MRIIVIGAGETGQSLVAKLVELKHDIVLIDTDSDKLAEVNAQLDVLTVEGNGASPAVLRRAELDRADLLVAVSDDDEVNVLACLFAHAAGVPNEVARVRDADYLVAHGRLDLKAMGLNLLVSQDGETATDLYNVLRMPGAIEVLDLFEGKVLALGIKVHVDSPLLIGRLNAFPEPDLLKTFRFLAVVRGKDVLIPRGETRFMVGDDVYVVGQADAVKNFLKWVWPDQEAFEKVVIAGGGSLSLHLAGMLEKTTMQVVLIEQDQERANHCSEVLTRTLVLKGDALNKEALESAGISNNTVFAAVLGNDEDNIIACLIAAKMGARFTLAKVGKPEYIPVINSLSLLDRVVSPSLSMINAILHYVRGRNVKTATLFHRLPGELLEVVMKPGNKWIGKPIKSLKIEQGILIAAAMRGSEVLAVTGDLILADGDRVVVFALPDAVRKLEAVFHQ